MRFRLRTLLILLAVGPPVLAGVRFCNGKPAQMGSAATNRRIAG
jgi:hypothetical protein